jgi:hypothetical protein
MATTIPTLSPGELREKLQQILELAEDVRTAENNMRAKAVELRCDWDTSRYVKRDCGANSAAFASCSATATRTDSTSAI